MVNHIFVGIDLGDKNSVARIALQQERGQRVGFVNDRRGRERLFERVKRQADEAGGAKIVMAYEASSCGFILRERSGSARHPVRSAGANKDGEIRRAAKT